jgi:hypothetical protein
MRGNSSLMLTEAKISQVEGGQYMEEGVDAVMK